MGLSNRLSWLFSAVLVVLLSGQATAAAHDGRGITSGLNDRGPAAVPGGEAAPGGQVAPASISGQNTSGAQALPVTSSEQARPGAQALPVTSSEQARPGAQALPVTSSEQARLGAQGPSGPPRIPGQNANGLQVYLRAGLKTHGPGLHDYPQFLADWSKFLTEHGAVVTGSLHAPLAQELSNVAVLVIYKGDAGYLSDTDREALEAFIKRGGGVVSIHDALCGPDPAYFATLVGGGKKHGDVNYTLEANVPYTVVDSNSPLMKGIAGLALRDEAFFNMTWAANPKVHVLATTVIDGTPSAGAHKGEVVPQIWTYEHSLAGGQPARAFVWMQGHKYANFAEPPIQNMLLRAIAWAGRHPVDELLDYRPPPPAPGAPGTPPATQPPPAAHALPAVTRPPSAVQALPAAVTQPPPAAQALPSAVMPPPAAQALPATIQPRPAA